MKRFFLLILLLLLAKVGSGANATITITGPTNGYILSYPYGYLFGVDYSGISTLGRYITHVDYIINNGETILSNTNSPFSASYFPPPAVNHINDRLDAKMYMSDGNIYSASNPMYITRLSTAVQVTSPVDGTRILPGTSLVLQAYADQQVPATGLAFVINNSLNPVAATAMSDAHGTKYWSYTWSGIAAGNYTIAARAWGSTQTNSPPINLTVAYPPPTVATSASASPSPVTGTQTILSVLGADPGGESTLSYTWSATGPAAVAFGTNGSNSSKNIKAIFTKAGAYQFTCAIKNSYGLQVTSNVSVTVSQVLTAISISATATSSRLQQQFAATALDQFYLSVIPQPTIAWTLTGGHLGAINSSGLYQSNGDLGGPYTVTATSGTITGSAWVTTTATNLIVVTGDAFTVNSQSVKETVTISGAAGSHVISLTGATFSGGATSVNQAAQTTVTYTINPGGGSTLAVAADGTSIAPPVNNSMCTVGDIVRGPGLPLSVGFTSIATLQVTFDPPLPDKETVHFDVSKTGTGLGLATIGLGKDLGGIGGLMIVTGDAQCAPGVKLQIHGLNKKTKTPMGVGKDFTVCAHITNWQLTGTFVTLPNPVYPAVDGINADMIWNSDSAQAHSIADLYNCTFLEKVIVTRVDPNAWMAACWQVNVQKTGIIANELTFDQITMPPTYINKPNDGWVLRSQVWTFTCPVCGATDAVIPQSGFVQSFHAITNGYGVQSLVISDTPSTVSVAMPDKTYTSAAARGPTDTSAAIGVP